MDGYGALSPDERVERLEQALTLLGPPEAPVFTPATLHLFQNQLEKRLQPAPTVTAPLSDFSSTNLDAEFDPGILNVGQNAVKKLAPLGLKTYRDLLFYYPKRYEDRRALPSFSALGEQESVTVVGTITGP